LNKYLELNESLQNKKWNVIYIFCVWIYIFLL
jgi:hypothetical protein